jgi:formate hydrogenlyase subunit 3/multisubunit Na+/H+ antiporter MnhD subunit
VKEIEAAAKAKEETEEKTPEREPRLAAAIIILSLVFCLILAFWPQLHTDVIRQVAENYTFFHLASP